MPGTKGKKKESASLISVIWNCETLAGRALSKVITDIGSDVAAKFYCNLFNCNLL